MTTPYDDMMMTRQGRGRGESARGSKVRNKVEIRQVTRVTATATELLQGLDPHVKGNLSIG
jgi:hypothetical protein